MGAIISNFMEIILGKYAQFKGRAGRSEFWMFYLVYFIIGAVFSILMNLVASISFLYYIISTASNYHIGTACTYIGCQRA